METIPCTDSGFQLALLHTTTAKVALQLQLLPKTRQAIIPLLATLSVVPRPFLVDSELADQLFDQDRRPDISKFSVPFPSGDMMEFIIKFRPHVRQFLQSAHQLFEMHIYTMGDRYYAEKINKCVHIDAMVHLNLG